MKNARTAIWFAAIAAAVSPWNNLRTSDLHGFFHSVSAAERLTSKALQPSGSYIVDDGTAEVSIKYGDCCAKDWQAIFLNHFNVLPGATTIHSVEIAWGMPGWEQDLDGVPITIGVWSDPDGDGNPTDAVLLGSIVGMIQESGTDSFVTYCFDPPVELPVGGTSFFVGDMIPPRPVDAYPQALDQTTTHRQSWVAADIDGNLVDFAHPGNNNLFGLIDDFGIPGNFMIRADTATCSENLTLEAAASIKDGFSIVLPLAGASGVEDRHNRPAGQHTVVLTFNHSIVSVGGANSTCGRVRDVEVDATDGHNVVISLVLPPNDCNETEVLITATDLMDDVGEVLTEAQATIGLLIGDANGDRLVDENDLTEISAYRGRSAYGANFWSDINTNGEIDAPDFRSAERRLGTSLP